MAVLNSSHSKTLLHRRFSLSKQNQTVKIKTKREGLNLRAKNYLIGYSFILPNFLGFAIFILFPVVYTFVLSFMKWDGFNAMKFIGFDNFEGIFGDRVFNASFWKTILYVFFTVLLTLIASLTLAIALNTKIVGRDGFRAAIFFPYVASMVAIGAVWKQLFEKNFGPINQMLRAFGVENPPGWFASSKWAIWGIIIVSIWKFMGYYMLIYLAGLQDIPTQLYEAATIDGASAWQKFRKITLPMLTPSTFFVFIMLTINSFKSFDLVYVLTQGGPGTSTTLLVNYIYNQSFTYWNYGYASAASMILFIIVLAVTIIQFRGEKKFTDYL